MTKKKETTKPKKTTDTAEMQEFITKEIKEQVKAETIVERKAFDVVAKLAERSFDSSLKIQKSLGELRVDMNTKFSEQRQLTNEYISAFNRVVDQNMSIKESTKTYQNHWDNAIGWGITAAIGTLFTGVAYVLYPLMQAIRLWVSSLL